MVSRRILITLTTLSACLTLGALGLMVHTQGGLDQHPAQVELAQSLSTSLDAMAGRVDALAEASDLSSAREARQELARTVLDFDQKLLSLGDITAGAVAAEVQTAWQNLGVDLADLAAGEYAASSAAGRETITAFQRQRRAMGNNLSAMAGELMEHSAQASQLTRTARTAAMVLGGLSVLLGLVTFWPARKKTVAPAAAPQQAAAPQPQAMPQDAEFEASRESIFRQPAAAAPARPAPPFDTQGDLGLARASVDRVSVDMLTVARSAERMQSAVDSVTSALQGMLFSLNELAQDTHEGHRITRTANNAAVYASDTAKDLLETAREMGDVVARVRALAARSQEVAGRIESEAAATGSTGEAFTSVVANEVKDLAMATGQSTSSIEQAVDGILAGQREYEMAIGQIIKNVGAVRKVAAGLGDLMLEPPTVVQPGVAYQAPPPVVAAQPAPVVTAPAPAAAPQPESAAPAPEPVPAAAPEAPAEPVADAIPEPTPEPAPPAPEPEALDDLAAATDSLLDELADVAAEAAPAPEPVAVAAPEPEPVPEPAPEPEAAPETAAKPAAKKPVAANGNGNVFMLNKPKKDAEAPAAAAPAPEPEPEPEPVAEPEVQAAPEPAPEPEPEAAKKPMASGSNGNVFMLKKPKKADEPEAAQAPEPAPEPVPEAPVESLSEEDIEAADAESKEPETVGAGAAGPAATGQGASGNIFMLKKPKK